MLQDVRSLSTRFRLTCCRCCPTLNVQTTRVLRVVNSGDVPSLLMYSHKLSERYDGLVIEKKKTLVGKIVLSSPGHKDELRLLHFLSFSLVSSMCCTVSAFLGDENKKEKLKRNPSNSWCWRERCTDTLHYYVHDVSGRPPVKEKKEKKKSPIQTFSRGKSSRVVKPPAVPAALCTVTAAVYSFLLLGASFSFSFLVHWQLCAKWK